MAQANASLHSFGMDDKCKWSLNCIDAMIPTDQNRLRRLEEMHQLAKAHNGVCLSKRYVNNKTKLRWRCAEGHEWSGIPSNILRGHWCRACGSKRAGRQKAHTIEMMQGIAAERGGECLSKTYKNNLTALRWRCKHGHEWEAAGVGVLNEKAVAQAFEPAG